MPPRTRSSSASRSRSSSPRLPEPSHPRPSAPEELGFEAIVYEKAPPRATITLNRPEVLNAFDFRMLRELARACEDASWDDEIRAKQAEEWGLVNRAVPAGELDSVVDYWVERLAVKLPQTIRYTKQQLNWWRDISWHDTVGHARDWLALSMLGDEAQSAVRRFVEGG